MGRMKAQLADLPLFSTRPLPAPGYPAGIPHDVCNLFENIAMDLKAKSIEHYSSDAILHRIRWHHHIEKGNREFKCNDHWTAPLARWVMDRHPSMAGFFETRKKRQAA